ncbi:MAG: amidohydrolase family protein [Bacillota bacterium]
MSALTLIKNAKIYGRGEAMDLLLGGGRVLGVGPGLGVVGTSVNVVDVEGRAVVPGLVDQHIHFIGAAGDEGPNSQTPELFASHLVCAGVTTAVGCLGFGRATESVKHLYAKAVALQQEGVSTFVYTGSFSVPSPTITGSVAEDIVLMDKVLGVKVAIGDAYCSQPTLWELARIASEAYVAGLQASKAGVVHLHVGHHGDPFQTIEEVQRLSGVPKKQFIPTHCNWSKQLVDGAKSYALKGGFVDLSTVLSPTRGSITSVKASTVVQELMSAGVGLSQISLSSDGNVGMPVRLSDGTKVGLYLERVGSLWAEIADLVRAGLGLEDAVKLGSENPARRLGLFPAKGAILQGSDADLLVVNDDLTIHSTYAKGVLVYHQGQCLLRKHFEREE